MFLDGEILSVHLNLCESFWAFLQVPKNKVATPTQKAPDAPSAGLLSIAAVVVMIDAWSLGEGFSARFAAPACAGQHFGVGTFRDFVREPQVSYVIAILAMVVESVLLLRSFAEFSFGLQEITLRTELQLHEFI